MDETMWWEPTTDPDVAAARTPTDAARATLDRLVADAAAIEDPRVRSRELASLERLIAGPDGTLRRLREARVAAWRERLDAGESQRGIAVSEGVTVQRVNALLNAEAVRRPVKLAEARERQRARVREFTEAARTERETETAGWLAALDAGEATIGDLAADAGLSPRTVRERVGAARAARDTGDSAGGETQAGV